MKDKLLNRADPECSPVLTNYQKKTLAERKEMVNHPSHYGGEDNPYEVIKVLKAWGLEDFALLWNSVKYIARWNKKGKGPTEFLENLKKAKFYLDRFIKEYEDEIASSNSKRGNRK